MPVPAMRVLRIAGLGVIVAMPVFGMMGALARRVPGVAGMVRSRLVVMLVAARMPGLAGCVRLFVLAMIVRTRLVAAMFTTIMMLVL